MVRVSLVRRRALLTVLAVSLLFVLSTVSAAAYALIPTGRDCLTPPLPADPTSGVAAMLDPGPEKLVAGDPFNSDSATMYDRYNYAGLRLSVFDVPNRLDFCQPLVVDKDVGVANGAFTAATVFTALSVRLARLVTGGTFGSLWDPVQQALVSAFGGQLFIVGFALAGMYAATFVAFAHVRRGRLSKVAVWAANIGVIGVVAVGCVGYAVGVGAAFDKGITAAFQSAGEVTTGRGGRTASDLIGAVMVENVLYPTWQAATFGGDEKVSAEFSERLWKAGTLTREEQAALDADPAQSNGELDKRREAYKQTMLELQDKYPQTYRVAAGIETGGYGWTAMAGMLAVGVVTWFLMGCLVLILWATVYARVVVGVFPALAIPATLPRHHKVAYGAATGLALAAWQAFVASLAFFGFLLAGVGMIMRAQNVPLFVRVAGIVLLVVAMTRLLAKLKAGAAMQSQTPRWARPRVPKWANRRAGGRWDQRRKATSGKFPWVTEQPPDEPREPGAPSGPPPEAQYKQRTPRNGTPPRGQSPDAPVDLGELRSAKAKQKGRGAGAMKAGALVAGRAHPVASAALTAGSAVQKRRALISQAHGATRKRELPAGRQHTGSVQNPTGAGSTRPSPRKTPNQGTGTTGPPIRPTTPVSRTVIRGTVVSGARGYHGPPGSPHVGSPGPAKQ